LVPPAWRSGTPEWTAAAATRSHPADCIELSIDLEKDRIDLTVWRSAVRKYVGLRPERWRSSSDARIRPG
jgi:hypothetical protein